MYQRAGQDSNINIKTVTIGSENADNKMQKLFEHCSTILSGNTLSPQISLACSD